MQNKNYYWSFARPNLITTFNFTLQSNRFRLKGLLIEISPYLLITNATRNLPMTTINNLSDCFNFKLFRITLTAHGHLRVILSDSEVSVKPVAIQNGLTSRLAKYGVSESGFTPCIYCRSPELSQSDDPSSACSNQVLI